MPKLDSMLWSKKSMEYFDTPDDLKAFVADQRTKLCRFIGKEKSFVPEDVELKSDIDWFWGWKNYCNVVLDGKTIGFCGE
jgi:hypothetical protein